MRDKVAVDLGELLEIANDEYARRPEYRPSSSIAHITKRAGTFSLEFSGGRLAGFDTAACDAFAQSLYDRYLLKI
ncbi:hypothetical protein [Duganella levis]|uniref:Uncharacterized protein n=1 Tax=Duganella levis TaxID=2692169 RepID=A0ABW9VT78_9BURK|nr:hypothetical protein [Duganella levis]MYN24828.1 hypothetical protein [Duganella levis]